MAESAHIKKVQRLAERRRAKRPEMHNPQNGGRYSLLCMETCSSRKRRLWVRTKAKIRFFNQICGNTGQTDTRYTGNIATTAPTSNNIAYPNGTTTEAEVSSATTSNAMKISYINAVVEKAKMNSPMIRPLRINGESKYVMFLHPYQVTDLRNNTSTGEWLDIQKAAIQGGNISKNPIYTGALGEYNNVILHESTRVKSVTANVYRAVLCGAQAAWMGYGQGSGQNKMTWKEELFDYGNQLGVAAGLIFGLKKTVFNSQDFGTIVLPTYAVAH